MEAKEREISLADIWNLFRPKLWLILLVAIVFAGTAGLCTRFMVKQTYTSRAGICVYSGQEDSIASSAQIQASQMNVPLYMQFVKMDSFLSRVKDVLVTNRSDWSNLSIKTIRDMITTTQYQSTQLFTVSVTTQDPALSYEVARAIADVAENQMDSMLPDGSAVKIVDVPALNTVPNGRGTLKNMAIFGVGGAVLVMAIIFVMSLLDITVYDRKKIEDNFDVPILGVVPDFGSSSGKYGSYGKYDSSYGKGEY